MNVTIQKNKRIGPRILITNRFGVLDSTGATDNTNAVRVTVKGLSGKDPRELPVSRCVEWSTTRRAWSTPEQIDNLSNAVALVRVGFEELSIVSNDPALVGISLDIPTPGDGL